MTRLRVPRSLLEDTEDALRAAGRDGYELFVLWTGSLDDTTFNVEHIYVPAQESFKMEEGLCVTVHGDALHQLNQWLFQEHQTLLVQVHAHPAKAFHSDTDDHFPIVTLIGGFSIVAADFCLEGLRSTRTAYFRLLEDGWVRLVASEVASLVEVSG